MTTGQERLIGLEEAVRRHEQADPYSWIREATDAHRRGHRCWAYPYADGSVLGAIAAYLRPARVLELGTALGYTACWWARAGAQVDSVERDEVHVDLARENVELAAPAGPVDVHQGDFGAVLPALDDDYDLAFFDGYEPPGTLLGLVSGRLRPEGALITTNLDLGDGRIGSVLAATPRWHTVFVADLAVSIRVAPPLRRS